MSAAGSSSRRARRSAVRANSRCATPARGSPFARIRRPGPSCRRGQAARAALLCSKPSRGVTSKQIDRAAPEKEQAANRDTANRRKKLVGEAAERSDEPDYVEIPAQER